MTYTIKIKSTEALMTMRAGDEAIMDIESCNTFGDKIYSNAELNDDSYAFPMSYTVTGQGLFLQEEIEWVKVK